MINAVHFKLCVACLWFCLVTRLSALSATFSASEGIDPRIISTEFSDDFNDTAASNATTSLVLKQSAGIGIWQFMIGEFDSGNLSWADDIFGDRPGGYVERRDTLWRSAPLSEWMVFLCSVGLLLILDAFRLRHLATEGFMYNLFLVGFWVVVGALYNVYTYVRWGPIAGMDWMTGYLLEWMLSLDNLFFFHLIFEAYKTPMSLLPKALFYGVVGAVVFRMLFFSLLGEMIHLTRWFRYFLGGLLVYSGLQAAMASDDDDDLENTSGVQILHWAFGNRLSQEYDVKEERFFVVDQEGRYCATLLFFVVLFLQLADLVFAIDSVSAKVAQIQNQYTAYSSSVFAMLGLRSMFFVIKELVEVFDLLKFGICIILCFVGIQLVFADALDVSSQTFLLMIVCVFSVCIVGSVARTRLRPRQQEA